MNGNEFLGLCALHHRWGKIQTHFAAERTRDQSRAASSAQWDTFEEVIDTEEEEDNDGSGDTIDPGDSQEYVRATCMDNGENDAQIPGVDASQLEAACFNFAELPDVLAIVQAARRGASDSNRHSRGSPEARVQLDQHLYDNVNLAMRVISDTMMTDQPRLLEGPNVPGHNLSNAEVRTCKQSWTSDKLAAFVMRVTSSALGSEILSAQASPLTLSTSRTKSKSSSRTKTGECDESCQWRMMFLMCVFDPPHVLCSQ